MKTISSALKFIAINVDCVATGYRHDDRHACSIVVVGRKENIMLSERIKPDKRIMSYLSPLTGIKRESIDNASTLASAQSNVKSLLGPDVVLVSHRVTDLRYLQLEKNVDYIDSVDLSQTFSYYSSYYNNYSIFSLHHQANTLLGHGTLSIPDTPEACTIAMMKLFNKFYGNPILTLQACTALATVRPPKSFARRFNYSYEGVCLSSFREDYCTCGAPIFK